VSYFEEQNLEGFAHWMRVQYDEEIAHAMRLFNFLLDHDTKVTLLTIEQPRSAFDSPVDAVAFVYGHEQKVSQQIHELYELAMQEKAYTVKVEMEWFISEQLEEEKTSRSILDRIKMVGKDTAALFSLDRELSARPAFNPAAE
jgi:ferritin